MRTGRPKIGFLDRLSLNAGQKYCKFHCMLYLKSLPHLAFAVGTLALSPSLSVISNMSNLPSDKHVTSRDGMAGFQAMSSRREPGAPFNRVFRKGDTFSLT